MPTSEQAMLADTFPPQKRAQAFAIYGIAVIVAPTVGPTIGGWITRISPGIGFSSSMCQSASSRWCSCSGWSSNLMCSSASAASASPAASSSIGSGLRDRFDLRQP